MRIAICEDREEDMQTLRAVLERYLQKQRLTAGIDCFVSGEQLLAVFEPAMYQIVFMDIYMTESMTGMETAEAVHAADKEAAIIFTTSSDAFGIAGYRVAVYYILKPVQDEEFARAMEKCRAQIERFAKTIEITVNRQTQAIRLRDIYYVESRRRSCVFITADGEYKTNMAIEGLAAMLYEIPFVQCHRSFVVNLTHVTDMLEADFMLGTNLLVPISRAYRAAASKAFREFIKAELRREPL